MSKEKINSKMECPVCALLFARNYLLTHLQKQHGNIFGTEDWANSRYAKNFDRIKTEHQKVWGTT